MGDALTIPKIESLKLELEIRRETRLRSKINQYPRKNPILSDLGDCDKQIAFGVTNWQMKKPPDADLQARFEVGNLMEREMIRELLEMGFEFVGGQETVTVKGKGGSLLATGRIDGFVKWQGERIPIELKSMNPNVYNSVDSVEDFQKKPWLRKYVRQLMMYCFGHNSEYGLFGLTNCLGGIKWFPLYLDYGECELLLKRLETVHDHLAAGTLPERIQYRDDVCGRCDWAEMCLKDVIRAEAEIITDDEVIANLEEREKLKAAHGKYGELDRELKKRFANVKKAVAGDFVIVGSPFHRDPYSVEAVDGWKLNIKKLSTGGAK